MSLWLLLNLSSEYNYLRLNRGYLLESMSYYDLRHQGWTRTLGKPTAWDSNLRMSQWPMASVETHGSEGAHLGQPTKWLAAV